MTSYGEPSCSLQCASEEGPWGNVTSSRQRPAVQQVQGDWNSEGRRSESEEISVAGTIRTRNSLWDATEGKEKEGVRREVPQGLRLECWMEPKAKCVIAGVCSFCHNNRKLCVSLKASAWRH